MSLIPDHLLYLLERPLYGHLATIRPDDTAQANPMWFSWDGEFLKFSNTTIRQKYRNIQHNPSVAMSVVDPDAPWVYLEVRGTVERIEPDPEGAFFVELAKRYGNESPSAPADKQHRVVYWMRATA